MVQVREDVEKGRRENYVIENGLLYRKYREKQLFVMPRNMRKSLVVVAHDLSGHPAIDCVALWPILYRISGFLDCDVT